MPLHSMQIQQATYLQSRIHLLKNFSQHPDANVFLKREDELSCGLSGSKKRKYASILRHLLENKIKHVIIIGSTHSNNILSALQVLRENQILVTALLLKSNDDPQKGNFKLSRLFLDEQDIIWIERKNWSGVENMANQIAHDKGEASFILTEGACVKEGIEGAKTLGLDILRNEQEHNLTFKHIFIDAGTGFSASCCIQSLAEYQHTAHRHIIELAGTFNTNIQSLIETDFNNTSFYTPSNAKSFGSVNKTVRSFIQHFAQEYGVLLDPIYSAKCLYESQKIINNLKLTGDILIIHSGGVLSLPNFTI